MTRGILVPTASIVLAAAAVAVLAPDTALAHGLVGREDLPIPRWLFGWAATAVLAVSFAALAVLWQKPTLEDERERRLVAVPRALEVLCGLAGVGLFAVLVWAGLAGTQSSAANITPTFVYVIFWVGVPVLSLLLGDVFAAFNPWRALGRAAGWAAERWGGGALPEPLPYPERLGRWPAAAGILAFAWVELVLPAADSSDPSLLAVLMLVYAAMQLVGMSLYGVAAWTRNGDAFGVLFGMFAALSPLHWRDGAVFVRRPTAGVAALKAVPGTVALLAVAIGSTSFDGFSESELWTDLAVGAVDPLRDAGLSLTASLEAVYTAGLLLAILLAGALFRLGVEGMRTVGTAQDGWRLARAFAHSLVPIALGYAVAHYVSLLAYQGQAAAYLASDPLGRGWDLFGTASSTIDYTVLSANGIWYLQVGALVLGHVAALALAHDRALLVFRDAGRATRSQYWMLAVMIAFTSLGLWLLSAASG